MIIKNSIPAWGVMESYYGRRATMKIELSKAAPDFTLLDWQDKEFTLSYYRGQNNIVLVFNRGFV